MIHANIIEWIILAIAFALASWLLASELKSHERLVSLRGRRSRQLTGLADELLYRRLIRPNVIKNSNGSYLAMFELALPSHEELDARSLAETDFGFAKALGQFGSNFVLHMHTVHNRHAEYDMPQAYRSPVSAWLDTIRRDWFLTPDRVFSSRNILTVTWMPPTGVLEQLRASLASGTAQAAETEDEIIAEFDRKLADFTENFSSYGSIRRLGTLPLEQGDRSEMLEHLAWCVGGHDHKLRVPIAGQALNGILAEEMQRQPLRIGQQHVRVVVLSALGDTTHPLFLSRLAELKQSYSLVIRFLPDDGHRARKIIRDSLYDWTAKSQESTAFVDPHAADMAESAREALGLVSAGEVQFGRASVFVVLRHNTQKAADELARQCIAILSELALKSYIAGWTAEDDFLATLPGDGYHSMRKYPIHALNVAHLFSPHGTNAGRRYNESRNLPADTPAVFYATTPERSLVRVHLSDRSITDVGNHFGVGGTGSGKSVLLGALSASYMARFPGAGFTGIDRGRSLYRLTRFLGGNFYDLLGTNSPGFAIFSHVEEPEQARAALEIIREMIELQGVFVDPTVQQALENALAVMIHFQPSLRSLTAFYEAFQDPTGGNVRAALRNYTRQSQLLGNILDAEVDSFTSSFFNVVEIARVMELGDRYLIPVLKTLFWKARTQVKLLSAQSGVADLHWLYQIDEAHTFFHNDIGRGFIRDMLKMGRKEKYIVGLWSNAAIDFAESGILNDISEACRSRFFFKNTEVHNDPEMRHIYGDKLGVPARGLERLPELAPRNILFVQPKTGEVWELDLALDKAWLAVIGRTDARDNERVDEYIDKYGTTWRQELLRYEGVSAHEIDRFVRLLDHDAQLVAA